MSKVLLQRDILAQVLVHLEFPAIGRLAVVCKAFAAVQAEHHSAFWFLLSSVHFGELFAIGNKQIVLAMNVTNGGRYTLFGDFEGCKMPDPNEPAVAAVSPRTSRASSVAIAAARRGSTAVTETKRGSVSYSATAGSPTAAASSPSAAAAAATQRAAAQSPAPACSHRLRPQPLERKRLLQLQSGAALPVKLVLLGSEAVGKTALRCAWSGQRQPAAHQRTLYDAMWISDMPLDHFWRVSPQLVDLGGASNVDRLRTMFLPSSNLFLLVFSAVSRRSFEEVRDRWLPCVADNPRTPRLLVAMHVDARNAALAAGGGGGEHDGDFSAATACGSVPAPAGTAVFASFAAAAGTTADAAGAAGKADGGVVSYAEGAELARVTGCAGYYECSALTFIRGDAKVDSPSWLAKQQHPQQQRYTDMRGQGGVPGLLELACRIAALHAIGFVVQTGEADEPEGRGCSVQ